MYLSFYITDSNNDLIFQYLPSASAPTYNNFIIKLKSIYDETDIDKQSEFQISKYLRSFKYHSQQNTLNYWCLTSEENKDISRVKNVALIDPYVFMEGIDELLMEYFDKDVLTIKKLTNNYDRLTMIFNYIIDDGEPRTGAVMYSNKVKDVIPLQKDLTKFISSTAKNITDAVATTSSSDLRGGFQPGAFGNNSRGYMGGERDSSKAPWRSTTKETYTKEELYLDFVESVHLVLQKHHQHNKSKKRLSRSGYINNSLNNSQLTLVHGYIHGSIEGHSLLNGTPTVELNLNNNGTTIDSPSFHDCVNCEDYINDNEGKKLLNTKVTFIPPDGKFQLMNYSVDLDGIASNNIGLISVNFENNLGINNDEFEISVNISGSVKVPHIKNLGIDLLFSEDMSSAGGSGSDDDLAETSLDEYKIKIINNTHGRFSNTIESSTGKWIFDSLTPTGTVAVLRGCVENVDNTNKSDESASHNSSDDRTVKKSSSHKVLHSLDIRYEHEGQLISGIKVNSIDVTKSNQSINPKTIFKGVKYVSRMKECKIREN